MSQPYANLKAVAAAHGVSAAAVSGWTKKPTWPIRPGQPLDSAKVDAFVAGWIAPHRKGKQKKPAPSKPIEPAQPMPRVLTPPPAAPAVVIDPQSASLEELEFAIRTAKDTDVAERLSKQVRALKVIKEIQERDGILIDAAKAKGEVRSVFHFFQTALMALPRPMAASVEGLTPGETEAILEGRLTEILGDLQRGLERAIGSKFEPTADIPIAARAESTAVGADAAVPVGAGEAAAQPDGRALPHAEPAAELAAGQVG